MNSLYSFLLQFEKGFKNSRKVDLRNLALEAHILEGRSIGTAFSLARRERGGARERRWPVVHTMHRCKLR